ncbi:MAG: DeoR family transcriptional regulator [Spirochaetaceae bacterium]|nr:DeoR family transcriptional regulator [Spirochaetaceae bacterium]
MKENPHITAALLSQKLDVVEKTIKRDLQYLKDKKIIERDGADKNGCWKIME